MICNRLLRDAEFFKTKLSKIEGTSEIGEHLLNIVKDKPLDKSTDSAVPSGVQKESNGA